MGEGEDVPGRCVEPEEMDGSGEGCCGSKGFAESVRGLS
jgi:hypothetical protein